MDRMDHGSTALMEPAPDSQVGNRMQSPSCSYLGAITRRHSPIASSPRPEVVSPAHRKAAAFATFARYLDLSKTFALAGAAAEEGQ
jgi:hypothetical protein